MLTLHFQDYYTVTGVKKKKYVKNNEMKKRHKQRYKIASEEDLIT